MLLCDDKQLKLDNPNKKQKLIINYRKFKYMVIGLELHESNHIRNGSPMARMILLFAKK